MNRMKHTGFYVRAKRTELIIQSARQCVEEKPIDRIHLPIEIRIMVQKKSCRKSTGIGTGRLHQPSRAAVKTPSRLETGQIVRTTSPELTNQGCYHQAQLYTQVLRNYFFKNGSRHLYGFVWWFQTPPPFSLVVLDTTAVQFGGSRHLLKGDLTLKY